MKKRLEDRLIELAFEERDGSRNEGLASSPEAAARLSEYRTMRTALGQLRQLPDHQLSTERLREALLHQGLKRRRAFPWQSIGYFSAACGLFVCAYLVSRDLRRAYISPKLNVSSFKPNRAEIDLSGSHPAPNASSNFAFFNANPFTSEVLHRSSSHVRRFHDPDFAFNTEARLERKLTTPTAPNKRTGAAKPTPPPPSGRVSDTLALAHPANALVLIQTNPDSDSGLDTAQEVTANGDVLVGG